MSTNIWPPLGHVYFKLWCIRLTERIFQSVRQLALSEGHMLSASVSQGQDGLLQEGQRSVNVQGLFLYLTLRLKKERERHQEVSQN